MATNLEIEAYGANVWPAKFQGGAQPLPDSISIVEKLNINDSPKKPDGTLSEILSWKFVNQAQSIPFVVNKWIYNWVRPPAGHSPHSLSGFTLFNAAQYVFNLFVTPHSVEAPYMINVRVDNVVEAKIVSFGWYYNYGCYFQEV
jgi:hypothetical protein